MFAVGDIVTLTRGKARMRVTHVDPLRETLSAEYLKSDHNWYDRPMRDFQKTGTDEMTAPTLYKVIGKEIYGTFLVQNSEGHMVLELKGASGEVKAFPKDQLEEVVPYTVRISTGNDHRHILIAKGVLEIGDTLVIQGLVYQVTQLNTKCKRAEELPQTAVKIQTTPLVA